MVAINFLLAIYSAFVVLLWIGWRNAIRSKPPAAEDRDDLFFSIVIPFRNEAKNLRSAISTIAGQTYRNFEIIAVDDHSTDDSVDTIKGLGIRQLRTIKNTGQGKKSAITEGVKNAKGDVIVTIDADCTATSDWLRSLRHNFYDKKIKMVFGPVKLIPRESFFSQLQSMEFASLVGSGAATASLGFPTLCNGANLAYYKDVFNEVNGFEGNDHISSGDDEFLMRKIVRKFPGSVHFAGVRSAIVESEAQSTLSDFFYQRIRWASKWRYNSSIISVSIALFIVAVQVAWIVALSNAIVSYQFVNVVAISIKALVEFSFLMAICRFLQIRWNTWAFLTLQVTYPFYSLFVGITSNFVSYSWKGRNVR